MKGMDILEIFSKTDCANIVPVIAGLWLERFCTSCEADVFFKNIQVQTVILKKYHFYSQAYDITRLFRKNNRLHKIFGLVLHQYWRDGVLAYQTLRLVKILFPFISLI